jgi:hypothetical protein
VHVPALRIWHLICPFRVVRQKTLSHIPKLDIHAVFLLVWSSMKLRSLNLSLTFCILFPFSALAQGGTSVVQTLTVEVKPMTKIAVSGNPGALYITDATVGSDVLAVSDNHSKYSMVTNLDNMKIVASINSPMPDGTHLMMKLESSKGVSNGFVDVSNAMSPVEVVTGLGKGSDLDQTITYTFAANASVGSMNADARVVTLTLTN